MRIFLLLFISSSLFSGPLEDLDKFIQEARIQYNVPGLAVAIVQDDKVIFAKGYGLCSYNQKEEVNPNTIFQLASVSKTFTSAGLGVLVDQKKLTWDDEVIEHLPLFALKDSYPTRYATSRDLLAHRTGLPSFRGDLLGKLGLTSKELLYRVRFIEPESSFRNKAFYSNVGFFVAGELLSALSNTSFEKAIQTSLLSPLKMHHSGFADNLNNANVASAHAITEGKIAIIERDKSVQFAAAGGVTSTALDMANWMIMHLNDGVFEGKQILKTETIKQMHAPSMVSEVSFTETLPINDHSSFSFGLGWNNYNYLGKTIVEKGGALEGVRTIVTLIEESKMGIVVLTNLNLTLLPELIRAKFLETYVGKQEKDLDKEYKISQEKINTLVSAPPKPQNPLPFKGKLSDCTGSFANDLYGKVIITKADDKLILKAGDIQGTLTSYSNNTFMLTWPTINAGHELITFTFGTEGKAIEFQTETLGTFYSSEAPKNP